MIDVRELNRAVLALAPAHEPREDAPATFAQLATCKGRLALPVWSGASDRTVYGCARVNWAFRAWHDATHLAADLDFTTAGELATARAQIRDFRSLYPSAPAWAVAVLWAEVAGQIEFKSDNGDFPLDQASLVWHKVGIYTGMR